MKVFFTLGIAFLGYSSIAQTTYPTGVSNVLARWNFTSNGTITQVPDISTNNHNGTAFNLTSTTGWRNAAAKGMHFNGTTSYALVPNDTSLSPQEITMVALVKFNGFFSGTCQQTQILSKGYPYFIQGNYGMSTTDNVYDNSNCYSFDSLHQQLVSQYNNFSVNWPAGPYFQTNQWYFIASSYSGTYIKQYQVAMDSNNYQNSLSPVLASVTNTSTGTNNQDLTIGKHLNPAYQYWFNGAMDEVIIFNKVLSANELQSVYAYLLGKVFITKPFNDTLLCPGSTFNVSYYVADNYYNGNIFTVQLSDASGSFSNPVNIGAIVSDTSGTIPCQIPMNTVSGSGYRIRVVPSTANLKSDDNGVDINIQSTISPTVVVTANPTTITLGQPITYTANVTNGGANPTYQWRKNNTNIAGATSNPYITSNVTSNDNIAVFVTGSGACASTEPSLSNSVTLNPTSIESINSQVQNLHITPNPTSGNITLGGELLSNQNLHVKVLNVAGQIIYQEHFDVVKGNLNHTLQLPLLSNGIYFLNIGSDSFSKTLNFTVLK